MKADQHTMLPYNFDMMSKRMDFLEIARQLLGAARRSIRINIYSLQHCTVCQVVVDLLASEWQYMTQSFDIDVMRNWEEVERDEADKSNLKRIRLEFSEAAAYP